MIRPRLCGFKPDGSVTAWNDLTFDAEGRNGKAVKDVLRDHGELHRTVDGYVQRINLMLATRVFGLPHPLLANDVDVHGVGGRVIDAEVQERTPYECNQEEAQRDDGPGGFQQSVALNLYGLRMPFLAVKDGEADDHGDHNASPDKRDQKQ